MRLQQHEFDLAGWLVRAYVAQPSCEAPPHVLFPQMLTIVQRFVRERVQLKGDAERADVFLAPYFGWAVESLVSEIRPDTAQGEAPEIPRYESGRGPGTTADVDFWTAKPVAEVTKSHVSYVVADTKKWEQSAAYFIDTHGAVAAFVKNQGLGLGIPYLWNGESHEYVPDFVIRLANGVHLIVETKGYDPLEDVKAQAARRWVDAVNADGAFGGWRYVVVHEMTAVAAALDEVAEEATAEEEVEWQSGSSS
jgi:type III restriction enzyme